MLENTKLTTKQINNFFEITNYIYSILSDEISKNIFEQKLLYSATGSSNSVKNIVPYSSELVVKFGKDKNNVNNIEIKETDTIVIYGAGAVGNSIYNQYKNYKYKELLFCDMYYESKVEIDGKKVISEESIIEYLDAKVIICTCMGTSNTYNKLLKLGFDSNQLYIGRYYDEENQYFDSPINVTDSEIFADCGVLDGKTSILFTNKVNNKFKKIHLFEPDSKNYEIIEESLKNHDISNYVIHQLGLWSKKDTLYFDSNSCAAMHITDSESNEVNGAYTKIDVDALDNIFENCEYSELPTFIKMDIEGAELNALKGSSNIIKKSKPKLAICVYHKPEDILEIILYIKSLVPEYKFYLRHYTTNFSETVLYATL